jgi:hypothetical protein
VSQRENLSECNECDDGLQNHEAVVHIYHEIPITIASIAELNRRVRTLEDMGTSIDHMQ